MKEQQPERNIIINRKKYYDWIEENAELLSKDNTKLIKNLQSVFSHIKDCADKGVAI